MTRTILICIDSFIIRTERTGRFRDGVEVGLQQLGASRLQDSALGYLQDHQEGN
jgi:hypothetical protein